MISPDNNLLERQPSKLLEKISKENEIHEKAKPEEEQTEHPPWHQTNRIIYTGLGEKDGREIREKALVEINLQVSIKGGHSSLKLNRSTNRTEMTEKQENIKAWAVGLLTAYSLNHTLRQTLVVVVVLRHGTVRKAWKWQSSTMVTVPHPGPVASIIQYKL